MIKAVVVLVMCAVLETAICVRVVESVVRPHCESTEIAQRADSTFYETVCLGGAKP